MKFVSIWQGTFRKANNFVTDNGLQNFFVQFVEDKDANGAYNGAYWIVFKDMPNGLFEQLLKIYDKPKLYYL